MSATPTLPPPSTWHPLVAQALDEDIGPGDITTQICVTAESRGRARIEAREALVVCGLPVAAEAFHRVDRSLVFVARAAEGAAVAADTSIATVEGAVRGILTGERTALNFLARMCGIASTARRYVEAVAGTGATVLDTRKTLPGWRTLDKYAAATGGARNHRVGLFDGILIKDNHIAAAGGIRPAVKAALSSAPAGLQVEVEVQSEAEAREACDAGAATLLLDNCSPELSARIVEACGDGVKFEASGGIVLENVRCYALAGVHYVSSGALTHSAPGADLALEMET